MNGQPEHRFEYFSNVFQRNIRTRSRTAKGSSDTSVSPKKKGLLKSGDELIAQVAENTNALIQSVWYGAFQDPLTAAEIRTLMECWYDLINHNLQDPNMYSEEQKNLRRQALRLARREGLLHRINPRYRVWDAAYTSRKIPPVRLELAMDEFYKALSEKVSIARRGGLTQAELLAWADHMIDSGIHPWSDGCGRHATATVMWLSMLVSDFTLPIFGTREEHYSTIEDIAGHTRYFKKCLRGDAE